MTTESSNLPAQSNGQGTAIAKSTPGAGNFTLPRVDLAKPIDEIPDLSKCESMDFNMMSEYWSPDVVGEKKDLFFQYIADSDYPDQQTGEVKTLPTAFFLERRIVEGKPEMVGVCNASARLVGRLQDFYTSGILSNGTPLRITYKGKTRNKTNANSSADWDVKPIMVPKSSQVSVQEPEEETAHIVEG